MTQQTEAQRLADELDAYHTASHHKAAAAELRRLEAEVERKAAAIKFLWQECDRQEALNAKLLEAVDAMLTHMGMDEDSWNKPTFDQARSAIKAAKGKA